MSCVRLFALLPATASAPVVDAVAVVVASRGGGGGGGGGGVVGAGGGGGFAGFAALPPVPSLG